jgi:hypothetical protein
MYPDSLVSCGRLSHIGCGGWYVEVEIGAPEDITGILRSLVPAYDAQAVRDIVNAQAKWSASPRESSRRAALKAAFLKGDYKAVLK